MARIFAYIVHRRGVADDSAFELAAAARKIDAAASPTAILTGWGADLDAACDAIRGLRTLRSGKLPTKLLPTPMPN